jgi:glycosyltransferase 2 family protein
MKKKISILLGILFSVIIVYFLFKELAFDLDSIWAALKSVPVYIFVLSFVLNIGTIVVRSFLFKKILQNKVSMLSLMGIVTDYQFYNNFLPYRTGELSYLILLGAKEKIPLGESSASLLISRIFDFLAFILLLIVSLFLINIKHPLLSDNTSLSYAILTSLFLFFSFVLIRAEFFFKIADRILNIKRIKSLKFSDYLTRKLKEMKECFLTIKSPRKLLFFLSLSLILVALVYLNTYIFLVALDIHLTFFQVVIAMSVTILTILLPIQGFANLGTFEGTLLLGLLIFNVEKSIAIPAIFTLHIYSYLVITITFLLGKLVFSKWMIHSLGKSN